MLTETSKTASSFINASNLFVCLFFQVNLSWLCEHLRIILRSKSTDTPTNVIETVKPVQF